MKATPKEPCMAKATSFTIKETPSYKVIGLAYDVQMMDNVIPQKWDLFFKENKHLLLQQLRILYPITEPLDYVGLMVEGDPVKQTMIYVIGAIMDVRTPDQQGYTSFILPKGLVLNAVIEGKDEVYGQAREVTLKLVDTDHYDIPYDFWSMEVYTERFMKAQEKQDGSIILDYRIPLNHK